MFSARCLASSAYNITAYNNAYNNAYNISFIGMEPHLNEFSRSLACENPKLERLQEIILSFYAENENAQGIIFCKTREMTYALMNWMKESPLLADLNPHNITGSGNSEKHGLSLLSCCCCC